MQTPNPTSFSRTKRFHTLTPSETRQEDNPFPSLLHMHGVILGMTPETGHLLVYDGPENVLLTGPSRSGKGIGTVIPTALVWKNSAFFFDRTGALWDCTSGYRKRTLHQRVIKFAPLGAPGETLQWNPFSELRIGTPQEEDDLAFMAYSLLNPTLTYRLEAEQKLFHHHVQVLQKVIGILMHQNREAGKTTSLKDLLAIFQNPDPTPYGLTRSEQQYIWATLIRYQNPVILQNTVCSDFRIEEFVQAKHPASIYLVSNVHAIKDVQPIAKLFVSFLQRQLMDCLWEQENDGEDTQRRLLFVLDDFLCLDYLPQLPTLLKDGKQLGVQCLLTAQSVEAIRRYYVDARFIQDFCKIQIYHKPGTRPTAAFLADLLKDGLPGQMDSLTSDALLAMRDDKEFLCFTGKPVLSASRFRYYLCSSFLSATKIPPAPIYPEPERIRSAES